MIAHQTVGGCPIEVGDLLGSGTISGTDATSLGSFLEASNGGKVKFSLSSEVARTFLEDGDSVTISGWCGKIEGSEGGFVGFGQCHGKITPALVYG